MGIFSDGGRPNSAVIGLGSIFVLEACSMVPNMSDQNVSSLGQVQNINLTEQEVSESCRKSLSPTGSLRVLQEVSESYRKSMSPAGSL
ncbi:hypothetical protein NQZ68_038730 [Dissostichus eleginoides]|nr:hypothetical protein NQZ68_038730 [Dissostichus eleginoides]